MVLAAGKGERLGGVCKATYRLPGTTTTFLEQIGKCVGPFAEVILVVAGGPHAAETTEEAERLAMEVVINTHAHEGMARSISRGFSHMENQKNDSESAFLWPVDFPFVQSNTIAALSEPSSSHKIVRPILGGRRGHPPLIGRSFFAEMAVAHEHPDGARGVLQANRRSTVEVKVQDRGILQDVDREEDLCEAFI